MYAITQVITGFVLGLIIGYLIKATLKVLFAFILLLVMLVVLGYASFALNLTSLLDLFKVIMGILNVGGDILGFITSFGLPMVIGIFVGFMFSRG